VTRAPEPPRFEELFPDLAERDYEPIQPRSGFRDFLKKIWAPIAGVGAVLLKFGFLAVKFFGIFISVAAYALLWGWKFGVGFVALIAVHEMGHYVEARRHGLHPKLPTFVPFIGAYVTFRQTPNALHRALIAAAGPVAGALGACVVWAIAAETNSRLFYALAFTAFLLNLINLLPFLPLDGGGITHAARTLLAEGHTRTGWLVRAGYVVLAVLLAFGMYKTHVPQHRL